MYSNGTYIHGTCMCMHLHIYIHMHAYVYIYIHTHDGMYGTYHAENQRKSIIFLSECTIRIYYGISWMIGGLIIQYHEIWDMMESNGTDL